jgi:hypothetical protein
MEVYNENQCKIIIVYFVLLNVTKKGFIWDVFTINFDFVKTALTMSSVVLLISVVKQRVVVITVAAPHDKLSNDGLVPQDAITRWKNSSQATLSCYLLLLKNKKSLCYGSV